MGSWAGNQCKACNTITASSQCSYPCSWATGQCQATNYYRQVSGVGGWGGECTCPDGQTYQVGDNNDACDSLACEGGTAGTCHRVVDETRRGYKVTCAQA